MSITQRIENIEEQYIELFNQNIVHLTDHTSREVNVHREESLRNFEKLGVPSDKDEDYKYTNIQPFLRGTFDFNFSHQDVESPLDDIFQCEVHALESYSVFVINGWYSAKNQITGTLPEGVCFCSLTEGSRKFPEIFEKYYGKAALIERDGFTALNGMFAQDGVFIYIPKNVVLDKPLQIVNIATGDSDLVAFQRNLVVMEENSQAKILVCDHTLSPSKFVVNSVTEVFASENVVLDYYTLQNQHNMTTQVAGVFVEQKSSSTVMTNNLTLHAGISRNNIYYKLDGEYCESYLYGLYVTDKNQHVDNFTFIDHAKPNCTSTELFKGVMDDRATGAFTGRVLVRKDSQNTNAYQSNNNILLSDLARISTRPQLEIYADDVKCSHGATIGQLDDEAMFYLRSRGISEEEARILLMYAFAYEVIDKIHVDALKEQIRDLVEKRFRGEFDKCDFCVVCGQPSADTSNCF
jgi:Fe-S cluster assembly protein SufD